MKKYKVPITVALSIVAFLAFFATLTFFLLNKFSPGYTFENGVWNFVSYDAAVGRRVTPLDADADAFYELPYSNFAADGDSVFFKAYRIEGSDPETFEVISTKGRRHYAKDKNSVYVYVKDGGSVYKVYNADPETFEVLEFPYAKDKNDAYNGSLPLFVDDVRKFEVIEGSGFSHECGTEGFFNAITISEENAKYNREAYPFIDGSLLYSREGRAKTEKLVYEGYRVVEDLR